MLLGGVGVTAVGLGEDSRRTVDWRTSDEMPLDEDRGGRRFVLGPDKRAEWEGNQNRNRNGEQGVKGRRLPGFLYVCRLLLQIGRAHV